MDAGFTLARAHYIKLVILWLGFSLPIFLLCALIQYQLGWALILFVWWWFKPLYELPVIFYLSKALFSEPLSLRAAWKLALAQVGKLFLTYLTIARLSSGRSMTAGVVFLEQLPYNKRALRIQALKMLPTRHFALMFACVNIEIVFVYGIMTIVGALFFSETLSDMGLDTLLSMASESTPYSPWMLASSFTSIIAAALVAPFFVSGGFLIYINRRMQVEAWDIEHRFRRINPRNTATVASALLLGVCLSTSDPTIASDRAESLNSQADVAAEINNILALEDFGATKTRKVPKFKDDGEDDDDASNRDWLDWMNGSTSSSFAGFLKGLLYVLFVLFVGLLLYTLLQFKRPKHKAGNALSRVGRDGEDAKNHPLTQNLPTDIVMAAEHLLQSGERRQALSVLFRGALRSVMDEYDLKVSRGATESDCNRSVASVANENQTRTFFKLLSIWQKEAYANQPQQEQIISSLIEDWKLAFSNRPALKTDQIGDAS